jgi:hypothetical protein
MVNYEYVGKPYAEISTGKSNPRDVFNWVIIVAG